MSRRTGERCEIYNQIDDLKKAASIQDLVRRLTPILDELAYHAVNGEAAVMDTRDEWHTEYAARLRGDIGKEAAAKQQAAAGSTGARPPSSTRRKHKAPAAPPPSDLPSSLQRIMSGRHESFNPSDD